MKSPQSQFNLKTTKNAGNRCILWLSDQNKLFFLAKLLEENQFIEKADEWHSHFSTDALAKTNADPICWLKNTYELKHLLRSLKNISLINYPTSFENHFISKGKPLTGINGGNQIYSKLETINAIVHELR